jgi:drug/metabolite transporter (DMT)-like permease
MRMQYWPTTCAEGYLILFGSRAPERLATHAYLNPAVAVALGWLVLGETVTGRMPIAAMLILAAVASTGVGRSC